MEKNLQNELKKEAAIRAAEFVENDTVVGLGTGSTVKFLVDELGRKVREENLSFTGVTTSKRTASQAESLGIKIVSLDSIPRIDLTIDGADQVDNNFNGIKGGGAALLWEKIVATNSKKISGLSTNPSWSTELEVFRFRLKLFPSVLYMS